MNSFHGVFRCNVVETKRPPEHISCLFGLMSPGTELSSPLCSQSKGIEPLIRVRCCARTIQELFPAFPHLSGSPCHVPFRFSRWAHTNAGFTRVPLRITVEEHKRWAVSTQSCMGAETPLLLARTRPLCGCKETHLVPWRRRYGGRGSPWHLPAAASNQPLPAVQGRSADQWPSC